MPGGFYNLNKEGDTFSFRFSHEYCIIYRIFVQRYAMEEGQWREAILLILL